MFGFVRYIIVLSIDLCSFFCSLFLVVWILGFLLFAFTSFQFLRTLFSTLTI